MVMGTTGGVEWFRLWRSGSQGTGGPQESRFFYMKMINHWGEYRKNGSQTTEEDLFDIFRGKTTTSQYLIDLQRKSEIL